MKCIDCGYCSKAQIPSSYYIVRKGKDGDIVKVKTAFYKCNYDGVFLNDIKKDCGPCPTFIDKDEFDEIENFWKEHINVPF